MTNEAEILTALMVPLPWRLWYPIITLDCYRKGSVLIPPQKIETSTKPSQSQLLKNITLP